MSGTSADGIDAAVLETDGRMVVRPGPFITVPYEPPMRARLLAALGPESDPASAAVQALAADLTALHGRAVADLLHEAGLTPRQVALIGFHGHTLWHDPGQGRTCQIGDGAALARATGITVVNDFRAADMAAGGQGAPLAPLYHAARAATLARPLAVLNLGGVGNVTWIGSDGDDEWPVLLAFDTGPGNALLDDWMAGRTGAARDDDGRAAARGRADAALLAQLMARPWFDRPPPKSLDRQDFAGALAAITAAGLATDDGAATLTALTAAAVAAGTRWFPTAARRWLVSGGGRHNPVLMAALARRLGCPAAAVAPVEAVGWRGDALEAEAFAWLAVRSADGLPLSLPTTTGVARPTTGGVRHHPMP